MTKFKIINIISLFLIIVFLPIEGCSKNEDFFDITPGFKLWQLPSHSNNVMNSYIMSTPNGMTIVFDGGDKNEANYLYDFLMLKFKGSVSAWFISHQHNDHVGALTEILVNHKYRKLKIDAIYGSLLTEDEILVHEPNSIEIAKNLNLAISKSNTKFIDLYLGDTLIFDSIYFQVLGVKNPEIHKNFINNSSVVLRVCDNSEKSILFLGDLGIEGGNKLLETYKDELKSTYVQMSHHGSNGVNEDFYKAVQPHFCMWPATFWLWENDGGNGPNTGPFNTIKVREWMEELGVKKHYVMFDGLVQVF